MHTLSGLSLKFPSLVCAFLGLAGCANAPAPQVSTPDASSSTEGHQAHHGDGEQHAGHAMPHSFADVERWSAVFDDPERDAWQKPAELVASLGIQPGQRVIDVGAGTGYFNPHLARAVGADGHVVGADIETTLVEHMQQRAVTDGTPNVTAVHITPTRPDFPQGGADWVLLVDTYHHIEDRADWFAHVAGQMGRQHRLVIVDFKPGELPVGPPPDHKIGPDQVTEELTGVGYVLERANTELLPHQFVHTYRWDPTLRLLNDPPEGWTNLREAIPGAQFDIRYHTADNFTEAILPGYGAEGAWLRDEPAQALLRVHESLAEHGFGVKVYDAYRPLRGTLGMVAWAERTDQVHLLDNGYIARRSGHNRGNTIDLSLFALDTGVEPDMGTAWDTLSEASHTRNATGEALERRLLLKQEMAEQGFVAYHKEWWHFTYEPDDGLPHRDVPYGCFEAAEGEWTAPDGWNTPGYAMPTRWADAGPCEDTP